MTVRQKLISGFAMTALVVAGGVAISLAGDSTSSDGLKGSVILDNGLVIGIDEDQTAEEAAALESGPPFRMPEVVQDLEPGTMTTAWALERAAGFVENPTNVQVSEAVLSADTVREFVHQLGIESPPIDQAAGDVSVTLIRLADADTHFVAPRAREGSSGVIAADTFVSLVSGPQMIDSIVIVDWETASQLIADVGGVSTREATIGG